MADDTTTDVQPPEGWVYTEDGKWLRPDTENMPDSAQASAPVQAPATPQGRVYIGPKISDEQFNALPQGARVVQEPPAYSQSQSDAAAAYIAAGTRPKVTAPGGGGVDEPMFSQAESQMLGQIPLAQQLQAVQAAVRYQGMRGYQNDLNSGKPAAEALARNAPALFFSTSGSQHGGAVSAATGTARPMTAFQQAQVQRWQNPVAKVYAPTNLERLQKALAAAKASGDTAAAGQIQSYIEKLSTRAPARVGATGADAVATVSVPVDASNPLGGHVTRRVPASQVESIFNKAGVTNEAPANVAAPAPAKAAATISIGAVRGGYRFKGGDPRKKENWEKVE